MDRVPAKETVSPSEPHPGNLILPSGEFVPGTVELGALAGLLRDGRGPLTLVGAPGVGKTRLALELAAVAATWFPGGTWVAELAPITDGALVAARVADAVGLEGASEADLLDRLAERLSGERTLLVLDNCEHLVDACGAFLTELLARTDQLSVIVTTRERLGVAQEVVQTVPPLAVASPDATAEAIAEAPASRLFLERALAAGGVIDLTNPTVARAVAEICRRLDGLPLALELAASRTSVLSVVDIAARLDNAMALLASRRGALPDRQRTLRALLEWSDSMLDDNERALLLRLAVFTGSASLDAIEKVCGTEPLDPAGCVDALQSLAERSLTVVDVAGERTRYRLLETVRIYALDRLREASAEQALRARHADWCASLLGEAQQLLRSGEQARGFELIAREQDNWRAALGWLIDQSEGARATQMAALLGDWWYVQGRMAEGRTTLERVLAVPAAPSHDRAIALRYAGALARTSGDIRGARRHIGDGIAVAEAIGDRSALLQLQISLGAAAWLDADEPAAAATLSDALITARTLSDRRAEGSISYNLALLARNAGALDVAQTRLATALSAWHDVGDQRGMALANGLAATVMLRMGDPREARAWVKRSLEMLRGTGHAEAIVEQLETVAALDALGGNHVRSARLLGASDAVRRSQRLIRPPNEEYETQRTRDAIYAALGGVAGEELGAGERMSLDDAVALALGQS